jgi:DNA-binding beta-propeller fold protein YncE
MLWHKNQGAGGAVGGWDLSNAVFEGEPAFGEYEVGGNDVFFKPDGTMMYFLGGTDVKQYQLSTAWDITTASSFTSTTIIAQATSGGARGISFKPDGTKMYVVDTLNEEIYEYNLSTAWVVSSASYLQKNSGFNTLSPRGLFFKPDGSTLYVAAVPSGDYVRQYSLSTAWDITTLSYVRQFSVNAQEPALRDVFFKSDGTTMFVTGAGYDSIFEYSLSTAWDISTASYVQGFSVSNQVSDPNGLFFKSDGERVYVVEDDKTAQYNLSTAWDVSTATWPVPTTEYLPLETSIGSPSDLFFRSDGEKMYVSSFSNGSINEYDLSSPWDISTASYLQAFSSSASGSLFFKPDGTKMYALARETQGTDVKEYALSSAWDISTAAYVQNFSVSAQVVAPRGISFKPDGTKMYVTNRSAETLYEYDLSTAWDISTASFLQSQLLPGLAINFLLEGVFFRPNGAKMYVVGVKTFEGGTGVYEYNLSTAWDISTASYVQNFLGVKDQDEGPFGLFFKTNGTKMYIAGIERDAIFSYSL